MPVTAESIGQETKEAEKSKGGKGKVGKGKVKGQRQRQVEQCRKKQLARIIVESGTPSSEQGEEQCRRMVERRAR